MITNDALYKKTPQEITGLLYEALYDRLEEAVEAIEKKDMMRANEKLKKANDILTRLGAGINYEAGIIADQLDALYSYMADTLVTANFKKDKHKIEEVLKVLAPIIKVWQQALQSKKDVQPTMMKQRVNAYEKNAVFE